MMETSGMHTQPRPQFREPQVNLYVTDVERSARFYAASFGFVETFRTPKQGPPIHVELKLDRLLLGVASVESVAEVHGIRVGGGPPRAEVVLWTDDVDAAFARLTAMGVPELSAPHNFIGKLRAAWVADPDGNPVQLVMQLHPST
jgi:catechol 2,3-dioxygenase-like lactoylglutathione lyase family enzyme